MKIGFSSNAFINFSLLDTIQRISNAGYDGIEIVVDTPHAFLPLSDKEVDEIKHSLKINNLEVSNLNANTVSGWYSDQTNVVEFEPSLSNKDEILRKWRIDYTKKAIQLASELECDSICITTGLKHYENIEYETTVLMESLSNILEFAEKFGIKIAMEYEPGLLVENSEEVLDISNDFKDLGLNLDTCHVAVLDEDFSAVIQKFKNKIFHTHVSDCKNAVHYHLIPGTGEIDFHEIHYNLKKINYDGFLTAELYTYAENPEEALSETFNFLKNLNDN
jgi:protein FrlC|tara:strand:+ start:582 stop:1412 length:831 start_codon:yes stop_codon:yes gene_type:complete